ncbi:class C sortase [Corynebacterium sp. UMB9976]|uniref:class C sortase n=1 Tax=Corynebacterium sp. UMB9976 TaxID=3046354 RepID=UPI00254FD75C|nr:class C sortase [Corynebacterium sp. UMB9976]MDK6302405.1 class C sortase [Corynebacterium sp. UMB9976]
MDHTLSTSVEPKKEPRRANSTKTSPVLAAVLVILGVLVMLYPVTSTLWNNYVATKVAQDYAKLEKSIPEEVKNTQWDNAHKYNENRTTGPILDPWLARFDENNPDYQEYLDQLDANDAMARLIFPKIKADLPIFHGTDNDTLQKGLGHLFGSDLPVGGKGTHSVITGHTGLANSTMFDHLNKAEKGDAFYIQVSGEKLKYVVDQIKVVLPTETEDLRPEQGKDYITLITCTPYGINTHRLLVRGHQVPLDESDHEIFDKNHGAGWQWWMYALVAAAALVLLLLLRWLLKQKRDNESQETTETMNDEGAGADD